MGELKETTKAERFEKIDKLAETLEYFKSGLLITYGWEYKCDFPDSYWRWCKAVRGVSIERSISE
ncbi:hypothetical protein LCGC14_2864770 [marine sediment metagenome]|uniref:Uncharacterized protein n=1 Tax=marine sediment metagenome TaxID=412755 RepID=A0A0F8Y4Y0_9ZZZZ